MGWEESLNGSRSRKCILRSGPCYCFGELALLLLGVCLGPPMRTIATRQWKFPVSWMDFPSHLIRLGHISRKPFARYLNTSRSTGYEVLICSKNTVVLVEIILSPLLLHGHFRLRRSSKPIWPLLNCCVS